MNTTSVHQSPPPFHVAYPFLDILTFFRKAALQNSQLIKGIQEDEMESTVWFVY